MKKLYKAVIVVKKKKRFNISQVEIINTFDKKKKTKFTSTIVKRLPWPLKKLGNYELEYITDLIILFKIVLQEKKNNRSNSK